MPKELVISAAPHETRVAILEDGQLCEIYIEREKEFALVGSIYKGRVTRVLPGMQSAFVDIGLDSDAFLYVGDFLENLEDYDHVVTTVEGKVEKMEQQGGAVFTQPPAGEASAEGQPASEVSAGAEVVEPMPQQPVPRASGPGGPELEGNVPERIQTPTTESPSSSSFRSFTRPPGPSGQDRRPGGFGQGQGRDRGGDRRGGRWRRGRDRRGGRDLPPSKYAAPQSYSPHQPYEPPEAEKTDYEPIILPGESLAKYKDRIPTRTEAEPIVPAETAVTDSEAAEPNLKAAGGASIAETEQKDSTIRSSDVAPATRPPARGDAEAFSEYQALPEEPLRAVFEAHTEAAGTPGNGAELSEEEVSSLAEQLAEARHEEATAEAEVDAGPGLLDPALLEGEQPAVPESVAEAEEFISESEAQEREDAATIESTTEGGELDLVVDEAVEMEEAGAADVAEPPTSGEEQPSGARPEIVARVSDSNRARFQRPMRHGGGRRGHRPMRHQDHRQQAPRRPQLISEMLKSNQEIIVQIAKEPLGKKGARITSHVALPGRFLVYMPTVNHIGVSRRIGSVEERGRLRRLVSESKGTYPGGFIVRTAAEGAPDDEIRSDVEFLGRTWDKIRAQSEPRKAPALLHRDLNLVERILRDYVNNDYTSIWIDNEEEFGKVVEFVSRFQPKLVGRVKLYTKPTPIFEEFGIQQELDKALRPKVWLKSGGYIVINHTEALVAIDVNTGKYVGRGSTRLEDTIVKTNLEAVKEIIRQIRLRDLGGIIVLDFIDMEERRNRDKVLAALEAALRADRAPSKALAFNEFGLVCVTRKRTKQALERVLCQPCPYCTGSGMVKSLPTICYEIQAEARKMSADLEASSMTLRVHPEIAKALKTREAALIEELEQSTRKSVIIQADPTLHWEQYDIY